MTIRKEEHHYYIDHGRYFKIDDLRQSLGNKTITLIVGQQETDGKGSKKTYAPYVDLHFRGGGDSIGNNGIKINDWTLRYETTLPIYNVMKDLLSYNENPVKATVKDPTGLPQEYFPSPDIESIVSVYNEFVRYSKHKSFLTAAYEAEILILKKENEQLKSIIENISKNIPRS